MSLLLSLSQGPALPLCWLPCPIWDQPASLSFHRQGSHGLQPTHPSHLPLGGAWGLALGWGRGLPCGRAH